MLEASPLERDSILIPSPKKYCRLASFCTKIKRKKGVLREISPHTGDAIPTYVTIVWGFAQIQCKRGSQSHLSIIQNC